MVTKEQAMTAQEFHCGTCTQATGPRGGVTVQKRVWRRTGQTQTWKTRPDDFKVPVKCGLYESGYIYHDNAHLYHVAADCPLRAPETADA